MFNVKFKHHPSIFEIWMISKKFFLKNAVQDIIESENLARVKSLHNIREKITTMADAATCLICQIMSPTASLLKVWIHDF